MIDDRYLGVRYTPRDAKRGHVESYFLKANDADGRRAVWIKATILAPTGGASRAVAEAWAIAFDRDTDHVAVKATVPFAEARFAEGALDVEVAGCTWEPGRARGRIETAGRTVAWDLAFEPVGAPLFHYPHARMYDGAFPTTKLVSPWPDVRVSGRVTVDGEAWTLDAWPGMLGHNWGARHTHLYAWGHCNAWEDGVDDFVFEGASARVKVGPLVAPMSTLLCVRHRGVRYDLNAVTDIVRNHGDISLRRWRFGGANRVVRVEGEMWAETDRFVGLFYENPSGPMTYCLNTKLAHAKVTVQERGRAPVVLRSRAAALEIATHDEHHGVRMRV
jgi:hypothetical protein